MTHTKKENRLQVIEQRTFEMGNVCEKAFKQTKSIPFLKAGISAYRCSMQAMREQVRLSPPKKRIK